MSFQTLASLFLWRTKRSASRDAVWTYEGTEWSAAPWSALDREVRIHAAALRALGLKRGDRMLIRRSNHRDWLALDAAAMGLGIVVATESVAASADGHRLVESEVSPSAIFVDGIDEFLRRPEDGARLQGCRAVVAKDDRWIADKGDRLAVPVISHRDFLATGTDPMAETDWARECALAHPEDVATIIYTAGTAGDSRGVMLSHAALVHQVLALQEVLLVGEDDSTLLVLPLSHVFGRVVAWMGVLAGVQVALARGPEHFLADVAAIRPHIVAVTPRVLERLRRGIEEEVASRPFVERLAFRQAFDVGLRVGILRRRRERPDLWLRTQQLVARRLVLEPLRERLGGRLKFFLSAGAPLDRDTGEYFHALELPVLESYGLTEAAGAVTVSPREGYRLGKVGRPLRGITISLAVDGEVLVAGPTLMNGYLNRPDDSVAALDERGRLKTGDVGELDEEGFLRITGRKRDTIRTQSGRMIVPEPIEERLAQSPLVTRAVLVGDGRPHGVALFAPHGDATIRFLREADPQLLPPTAGPDLPDEYRLHPMLLSALGRHLAQVNEGLGDGEKIRAFAVLPRPLSVEGGELTRDGRLRRRVVLEKYRDLIDPLFDHRG